MKAILAGGGTGGHLVPAIALARALCARGDQASLLVAGRPVEGSFLEPAEDIDAVALPLERGGQAGGPLGRAVGALRSVRAARRAMEGPPRADIVVGFGGLATVPAALASGFANLPLVLHEANAVPGRAVRLFARKAAAVACAFPDAAWTLPHQVSAQTTGMPLDAAFSSLPIRAAARAVFDLPADGPCLLVVGGSQGARALNTFVETHVREWTGRGIHVLHAAGLPADNARPKGPRPSSDGGRWVRLPFIEDMAAAWASADVALCRGGAVTVAEAAATATPALFVPYPHHKDRQQAKNAACLGDGALVCEEADLDDSWAARIADLAADERSRRPLVAVLGEIGRTDGTLALLEVLDEVLTGA